jgi:TPR repeat protein
MWVNLLFKIPVVLLLVCTSLLARADFESASIAYRNQNYTQAFAEFSELAEAGDPRAQTVLAIMYKYGESVPLDYIKAYNWYHRAAVQGYPPAQYNVGIMLADGSGVDRDAAEAVKWLQKAADAGYERARDRIAEVTGDISLEPAIAEPIAWSKSWNLRLPNSIRDNLVEETDSGLAVYRVQLGAMSTVTAAEHLWHQVSAGYESLFQDYQPVYRQTQAGNSSIFRLQVGPFDTEDSAERFCQQLRQLQKTGCLVVLTN